MTPVPVTPRVYDLVLRPLTVGDEPAARAAHAELLADAFDFLLGDHGTVPWPQYVERLQRESRGEGLSEGSVAATFRVAWVGDRIVGRASVRHELSDWLRAWGGHIGYGVRPADRRRGHATQILRMSLGIAADAGVRRALVVCAEDNPRSATVIERCGGVLDDVRVDPHGVPHRRYWIDTAR